MPCVLFTRFRARLEARKRLRKERQDAAGNPASKHLLFPRWTKWERRLSVSSLNGQKYACKSHTYTQTRKLTLTTPRPEPEMSAPPGATLSDSQANPLQPEPPRSAPVAPIDPEKAYLMSLPREVKLEIIDHICSIPAGPPAVFLKDPTGMAFSKCSDLHNLRLLVPIHRSGVS
jgi:hypothetical protein